MALVDLGFFSTRTATHNLLQQNVLVEHVNDFLKHAVLNRIDCFCLPASKLLCAYYNTSRKQLG